MHWGHTCPWSGFIMNYRNRKASCSSPTSWDWPQVTLSRTEQYSHQFHGVMPAWCLRRLPTCFSRWPNLDNHPPKRLSHTCSPLGLPCFSPCSVHTLCFVGFETASSVPTTSGLDPLPSGCAGPPDGPGLPLLRILGWLHITSESNPNTHLYGTEGSLSSVSSF